MLAGDAVQSRGMPFHMPNQVIGDTVADWPRWMSLLAAQAVNSLLIFFKAPILPWYAVIT